MLIIMVVRCISDIEGMDRCAKEYKGVNVVRITQSFDFSRRDSVEKLYDRLCQEPGVVVKLPYLQGVLVHVRGDIWRDKLQV